MKLKLTLEYDGSVFSGWQMQPEVSTVQGELERGLEVYLGSIAKEKGIEIPDRIVVIGSGRTDAGVHARGQVASFSWPEGIPFSENEFPYALNGITVPELSIRKAEVVPDEFDARYSPHIKCYRYTLFLKSAYSPLFSPRAWAISENLDIAPMIEAAHLFRGEHDFSSFRAVDCGAKTPIRTLFISELTRTDHNLLVYTVTGNGFLKQMIRNIVGTLVQVGLKNLSPDQVPKIFKAKNRIHAGPTAPAPGLSLEQVHY